MPDSINIRRWPEKVRKRYENYLRTSFFFRDKALRASFRAALRNGESLLKGPYGELAQEFKTGIGAGALAQECFPDKYEDLLPALIDRDLYVHQERAVRATHMDNQNVVVATGTASGKTESFLYPILFELYRQHLAGELKDSGVRAMILYPMNALANDQRERLGEICERLRQEESGFEPTFGQYIGRTPYNTRDSSRNGAARADERLAGELVFRDEMRHEPPHILLTNYSMLEYLLIRPDDSPLFDRGRGAHWQFIVLDEAHQYRGAKGMEMGMLVRRLKQRLRDGGRKGPFRCIATSATISSSEGEEDKQKIAEFAKELFGEPFAAPGSIFGKLRTTDGPPRRYHAFVRALEGAFLVHRDSADEVVLNRKSETGEGFTAEPLEIALCRECGQHYYVGRKRGDKLKEAVRDPSQSDFGVDYYLPRQDGTSCLCRRCGTLSRSIPDCGCDSEAAVRVELCKPRKDRPDQLAECENCGYQRGGIGDPVQEIVHGSDGPNTVIATALHELLPEDSRKVLAFADSRQEAAFFAWYAQSSYEKLRDRNLILRAIKAGEVDAEGLSIDDLRSRLLRQWEQAGLFKGADTKEHRSRQVLTSILREALTEEKRLSLSGVGLVRWFVGLPRSLHLPETMQRPPWNFTDDKARRVTAYLLDEMRPRRALNLPDGASTPVWSDVSSWPQQAYCLGRPGRQWHVSQWGHPASAVVSHFLRRLLADSQVSDSEKRSASVTLMQHLWRALLDDADEPILTPGKNNGTFRLNPRWLRIALAGPGDVWECNTCATLSNHNISEICPRNRCPGHLVPADQMRLETNHYRILYENTDLPSELSAEEHTAQIDSDTARDRQDKFKSGDIHLLSSSTTFEVGVDLGDLEVVFLRNVPPEPFNYTQRVGRAGRRDTPGLAVTYCRRNPHDLYHYEDPKDRVVSGKVRPPRLRMTNEKIILRHMVAVALSAFFRENKERFKNVESFVLEWSKSRAAVNLRGYCEGNNELKHSLLGIVPVDMQDKMGFENGTWIGRIAGPDSRLADAEAEICGDYLLMKGTKRRIEKEKPKRWIGTVSQLQLRMETIETERTLDFLSRKAIIPKYGFPVDVVELHTPPERGRSTGVILQRDLSQAIAEYAAGSKVVANKKEWESYAVKKAVGKAWDVRSYKYDGARSFEQWIEGDPTAPAGARKYLIPKFGFITSLLKKAKEPRGRARRLYTTRPFFGGFERGVAPETKIIRSVGVTKAVPGTLVILCEGRERQGFYICSRCGAHMTKLKVEHETPWGSECRTGTLGQFSLGHELVTDVVRLQFPHLRGQEWDAYSVAYGTLLGAAKTLDVPDTDLNVTIARGDKPGAFAIVLYDNVPGGAGLVAQLEHKHIFSEVLGNAKERVGGNCGCDSSCYGCLRSYRNQFAHPYLDRNKARQILSLAGE